MSNGYWIISPENTKYLGLIEGEPTYQITDPIYKAAEDVTKPIMIDFDSVNVLNDDSSTVEVCEIHGFGNLVKGSVDTVGCIINNTNDDYYDATLIWHDGIVNIIIVKALNGGEE